VRERTGSFDIPVFAVAALSLLAAGAIAWLRARPAGADRAAAVVTHQRTL
jgi:hypothetical protein